MNLPAREQNRVGVKPPMYNFSRVCQRARICIAFEEDSSGGLCSEESDGAHGKGGHSLAVYYSEPARGQGCSREDERRGEQRYRGPRGPQPCLPPPFSPSALTGDTRSLGD